MGIKQLSKLIADLAPDAVSIERVGDWIGRRIAIDVSNYLYQFAYKAENKKPNSHIAGFFQLVYELAKVGALPIMIMDGAPCDAKDYILEKRQAELAKKRDKITDLNDKMDALEKGIFLDGEVDQDALADWNGHKNQAKKLDQQIIKIDSSMWTEIRELFDLLGVPVIQAVHEADLLAARLNQAGLIDGIISEDLDHLTFGAPCLIRDFNNKREPDCRVYQLDKVLTGLDLTHEQFMDVCILCGCDYTAKIDGIAWKRAYQLIKTHGSIEAIVDQIGAGQPGFKKFVIPEDFNYKGARAIFKLEADQLDASQLLPKIAQIDQLRPLLINRCNYRERTLEPKFKAISALYKKFNLVEEPVEPTPKKTSVKLPKPSIKIKKDLTISLVD